MKQEGQIQCLNVNLSVLKPYAWITGSESDRAKDINENNKEQQSS